MNQRNTTQVLLFILPPLSTLSTQEKLPHFMRWLISLPFWVLPTIKQSFHLEKIRKHCIPGRPWEAGLSCAEVFLVPRLVKGNSKPIKGHPSDLPKPPASPPAPGWLWSSGMEVVKFLGNQSPDNAVILTVQSRLHTSKGALLSYYQKFHRQRAG